MENRDPKCPGCGKKMTNVVLPLVAVVLAKGGHGKKPGKATLAGDTKFEEGFARVFGPKTAKKLEGQRVGLN